jgi:uncharacterized protein with von Willebrand factor type A (vWA) domain
MSGQLASNVMHFARLLRRAGLRVGPADMLAAQQALSLVDIGNKPQAQAAMRATMVHRHEDADIFDHAFALYWRAPAETAAAAPGLDANAPPPETAPPGSKRIEDAFRPHAAQNHAPDERPAEFDASMTVSERERLQTMDFEAMSAAQIAQAKAEIARLHLPLDEKRTRRHRPDSAGPRIDLRATMRASRRTGGELALIARTSRTTRPPPLVVLCDISGSMARYAQILLHFLHAVANDRDRVQSFLFGTRLTNITRHLKSRDPEVAFQLVAHAVPDWSGGTRIGETIAQFNRDWSRRVLGQGAVVLLVTDGLDREGGAGLAEEMERLHKSCSRLVWLNPLLRWDGFAPKSQGIRAMLPHVDEFRTVHSIASLKSLIATLSRPINPREMDRWRKAL